MRQKPKAQVIANLDLEDVREGSVLSPLGDLEDAEAKAFAGWETPLAPRGGFRLESGLAVVMDEGGKVLQWAEEEERGNRAQ